MAKAFIIDFYGVLYSNFDWSVIDERIQSDELKAQRFAYLKSQSNKGLIDNESFRREVANLARDSRESRPAVLGEPNINAALIGIIKERFPGAVLALLSNGNRPDIVSQLRECGLYQAFDEIFTSSDMNVAKPDKAAYTFVIKQLDVDSDEVIIIDDSPGHTAAARRYGFNAIQFTDNTSLKRQLDNL